MNKRYFFVEEEKLVKDDLDTIYRFFKMGDLKVSEDVIKWLYDCVRQNTKIENKGYLDKASKLLLRKNFKEATKLVKKFYDENHVKKETISNEETTSGDVAPFSSMLLGKPLFRVPDSLFYKIGYSDRNQHGWYKKFYGTELGQWCKENRGKKFTIKHETKDLYIDCEAK